MHEEASRKSGPCELFALLWRWSRIEPEDDQREVPFAEVCGHVLVRSRRVFFVTVPCLRLPCLLLLFFSLCLFGEKLRNNCCEKCCLSRLLSPGKQGSPHPSRGAVNGKRGTSWGVNVICESTPPANRNPPRFGTRPPCLPTWVRATSSTI